MNATRSNYSVRSGKSPRVLSAINDEVKVMELDEFMAMACRRFDCPWKIFVKKDIQRDDYTKILKRTDSAAKTKKLSVAPAYVKPQNTPVVEKEEEPSDTNVIDADTLVITALYDGNNKLAEITLHKLKFLPRTVMQMLGLVLPQYRQLYRINIKRCRIDGYTIYELSKFLPLTEITEICLDDSPVSEANYALLLDKSTHLNSLSLCRCNIDDEACEKIAASIRFPKPAEANLMALNLSSNRITDIGAEHIGLSLRSNRHLRYLNLAGNCITDNGANHIFLALIDFPLTANEIMEKRRRYMDYLRRKNDLYMKFINEMDTDLDDVSNVSKKSKKKDIPTPKFKPKKDKFKCVGTFGEIINCRAENMALESVGVFIDPYSSKYSKLIDGYIHCIGNMELCYLNLSYNNLTYLSLRKLLEVLKYQSDTKKMSQYGLMKVVIEGNSFPKLCNEIDFIGDLLFKNIVNFSPKYLVRKPRTRISVIPDRNFV